MFRAVYVFLMWEILCQLQCLDSQNKIGATALFLWCNGCEPDANVPYTLGTCFVVPLPGHVQGSGCTTIKEWTARPEITIPSTLLYIDQLHEHNCDKIRGEKLSQQNYDPTTLAVRKKVSESNKLVTYYYSLMLTQLENKQKHKTMH